MGAGAVSLLLSFSVMTALSPAAAQSEEWDVDVPPGDDVIRVVEQGRAAPFTGQLFDASTALRWGHRIERYRARIRLLESELELTRRIQDESMQRQLRIVEESYTREISGLRADLRSQAEACRTQLQQAQHQDFWESWGFAFGMGALAMGVVVGVVGGLFAGL